MNVLIVELGATGDVVRTTPLLRHLKERITWVTAAKNKVLLEDLTDNLQCFSCEERDCSRTSSMTRHQSRVAECSHLFVSS